MLLCRLCNICHCPTDCLVGWK